MKKWYVVNKSNGDEFRTECSSKLDAVKEAESINLAKCELKTNKISVELIDDDDGSWEVYMINPPLYKRYFAIEISGNMNKLADIRQKMRYQGDNDIKQSLLYNYEEIEVSEVQYLLENDWFVYVYDACRDLFEEIYLLG